jgi:hypothetical protein
VKRWGFRGFKFIGVSIVDFLTRMNQSMQGKSNALSDSADVSIEIKEFKFIFQSQSFRMRQNHHQK